MSLKVYGASDDLVEVEGDIREEFNPSGNGPSYLAVSDGTVLRIIYDGIWHIDRIKVGASSIKKHNATDEDKDYSDVVTLTGESPFDWVVFGDRFEAASEEETK